jgi:hypothetical protein
MLMGTDDSAVEHQPFEIGILTEFLEQTIDQAALQPSIIPPFDRLKGAEIRRVLSSRPGARHPKQRVDKAPIVRLRPVLALAATGDQRQNSRPLIITQSVSIQNYLPKYRLGSSSCINHIRQQANCPHGLDRFPIRLMQHQPSTHASPPSRQTTLSFDGRGSGLIPAVPEMLKAAVTIEVDPTLRSPSGRSSRPVQVVNVVLTLLPLHRRSGPCDPGSPCPARGFSAGGGIPRIAWTRKRSVRT